MARSNPNLDISLHEGSTLVVIQRVRHGLVDVGVIAGGEDLPQHDLNGLRRDVLLVGRVQVAVPAGHRLAGRNRVPVHELSDEPRIIGQAMGENEPTFDAWPTLTDATVAYTSRDWPSRLGMVAAGLGIAVIPNIGAAAVPTDVVVIKVEDPPHRERSAFSLTSTAPTPAAHAMVAALRTEATRIALSRSAADDA